MNQGLTQDQILENEFNYIRETASQSGEDRHRLLNFYVGITTAIGTGAVGLFTLSQGELGFDVLVPISLLSFLLAVTGWIFLAMLVRLRQAWCGSMTALNHIKNYYVLNIGEGLGDAFLWTQETLPAPQKLWNIHFYTASLINFISSLALALSVTTLGSQNLTLATSIFLGLIVWFVSMVSLSFLYWISLVKNI